MTADILFNATLVTIIFPLEETKVTHLQFTLAFKVVHNALHFLSCLWRVVLFPLFQVMIRHDSWFLFCLLRTSVDICSFLAAETTVQYMTLFPSQFRYCSSIFLLRSLVRSFWPGLPLFIRHS